MNYKIKTSPQEFEKLLKDLPRALQNGWQMPETGLLEQDAFNHFSIYQYNGIKMRPALLYIELETQLISLSPVGGNNQLSEKEHNELLISFLEILDKLKISYIKL